MIVVSVQLKSAVHPSRDRELARMEIFNDETGDHNLRNYGVRTLIGRSKEALDKHKVNRVGSVKRFPSEAIHIWHLISEALKAVHYDKR